GRYRDLLSNDLGAVAGLLFDIGMERYPAPPREGDAATIAEWESNLAKAREEAASFAKPLQAGRTDDASHTEVQGWLRDLGKALGF
ncbi:type II restriction endonuclease, partial [Acinetobacter baumannii]